MFSVKLKSCLVQLCIRPCHVVSAEIAVTMAVLIENPVECEVQGVIRFLQADKILGYLAEEASSPVELFCCTTIHIRILPNRHKPCCAWVIPLGHLRASSVQSGPGTVELFPVSINEGAPCWQTLRKWWRLEGFWLNNQAGTWYEEGIHKLMPRYDKCFNVKGMCQNCIFSFCIIIKEYLGMTKHSLLYGRYS